MGNVGRGKMYALGNVEGKKCMHGETVTRGKLYARVNVGRLKMHAYENYEQRKNVCMVKCK